MTWGLFANDGAARRSQLASPINQQRKRKSRPKIGVAGLSIDATQFSAYNSHYNPASFIGSKAA